MTNSLGQSKKRVITRLLGGLICVNTALFLILALFHLLPNDAKSAIFVDFWGRFTVYSLWFIGFVVYRKYLLDLPKAKKIVIGLVAANIPVFLSLAYFDQISMEPDSAVFVDFWGRLTVYSLWVLCYEGYLAYMKSAKNKTRTPETEPAT